MMTFAAVQICLWIFLDAVSKGSSSSIMQVGFLRAGSFMDCPVTHLRFHRQGTPGVLWFLISMRDIVPKALPEDGIN
jgi:hypothetical protein